jgi:uncharacterized membrane protein
MNAEFPTNSQPNTMPSDDQIVQDLLPPASSFQNDPDFMRKEQNRLAWEHDEARIKDFLSDPLKYIGAFWNQYRPAITTLLLAAIALIAVNFVISVINFIVSIPLMGSLLQLIGIGYSAWFTKRYLLTAESRRELSQQIERVKQGIIGTTEDVVGDENIKAAQVGVSATVVGATRAVNAASNTVKEANDTTLDAKKTVIVQKSPEALYRFWRNFENLPQFMTHLESVKVLDDKRSHWVAKAPLNQTVEWDAQVIDEKENQSIVWKSLEGSQVDSTGSVAFTSANGSGTEVKVTMKYNPPAGVAGAAVAALFGENPQQQLDEDMERFKRVVETMAL